MNITTKIGTLNTSGPETLKIVRVSFYGDNENTSILPPDIGLKLIYWASPFFVANTSRIIFTSGIVYNFGANSVVPFSAMVFYDFLVIGV